MTLCKHRVGWTRIQILPDNSDYKTSCVWHVVYKIFKYVQIHKNVCSISKGPKLLFIGREIEYFLSENMPEDILLIVSSCGRNIRRLGFSGVCHQSESDRRRRRGRTHILSSKFSLNKFQLQCNYNWSTMQVRQEEQKGGGHFEIFLNFSGWRIC